MLLRFEAKIPFYLIFYDSGTTVDAFLHEA